MSPISVPAMSKMLKALRHWTKGMNVHIALPHIAYNAWALNPFGNAQRSELSRRTASNQLTYILLFLRGTRAVPIFSMVTLYTASTLPRVRATYYESECKAPLQALLTAIKGGALSTKVGNAGWTSELLHVQLPPGLPHGGHSMLHNIISDAYAHAEGRPWTAPPRWQPEPRALVLAASLSPPPPGRGPCQPHITAQRRHGGEPSPQKTW